VTVNTVSGRGFVFVEEMRTKMKERLLKAVFRIEEKAQYHWSVVPV
jgi:hypothetical protein